LHKPESIRPSPQEPGRPDINKFAYVQSEIALDRELLLQWLREDRKAGREEGVGRAEKTTAPDSAVSSAWRKQGYFFRWRT
jgi:hypothetical protein